MSALFSESLSAVECSAEEDRHSKTNPGHSDPSTATMLASSIETDLEDFHSGVRAYWQNYYRKDLNEGVEAGIHGVLSNWNRFLLSQKDKQPTCAVVSWSIILDIELFLSWWQNELGTPLEEMEQDFVRRWIPRWNRFLQIREGVPVVTLLSLFLTFIGLLMYVADMVTDVINAFTYAYSGEYLQFTFTLGLVYGAIIVQAIWKWSRDGIGETFPVVGLKNLGFLLVNWSSFRECWILFRVERLLYMSKKTDAHLVLELQDRRRNVVLLKITEGICEACPQAIFQFCLIFQSLEGNITWKIGFRVISTAISLCSAGAAIVNWKKSDILLDNKELPVSELIVLHAWAVPVTASRLLSIGLLLMIQPYVGITCVLVHIILYVVYLILTVEYCRTLTGIFYACMLGAWFCISPFDVIDSLLFRLTVHLIHFIGNMCSTVTWALTATQLCTHSTLFVVTISVNCTLFITGLIFCVFYSKYWY